jgi:putative transport protein
MDWLTALFRDQTTVAHAVLSLSLVAATGIALGSVRLRGVGLGVAGVLFSGLIFAHFGLRIEHEVLEFVREFGLILFVYTIGIQVGPGFLASLRRHGLPLNLMAAGVVLLGAGVTLAIYYTRLDRADLPVAVGLFSGATTNTPSLAAAQEAIRSVDHAWWPDAAARDLALKRPGLAYAVAYPFGIVGIIIVMLIVRGTARINLDHEAELLAAAAHRDTPTLRTMNLEVTNPNLHNLKLRDIPTLGESGAVISRILHAGKPSVARGDTVLHLGDVLLAVGPPEALERLRVVVGVESHTDVKSVPGNLTSRRILVTRPAVLGKSIQELDPLSRYGVTVTRLQRGEVELPVRPGLRLLFGDSLVAVGDPDDLAEMARDYGDSPKRLNIPHIIPLFVGLALGVIVGSIPLSLPGVPAPVKLGLAGGPLLVAIILSRVGNIGPLVWYMPVGANMMLREIGIALFLACVGLKAGDQFFATLAGPGLSWLIYGALITLLPLLAVGLIGRLMLKVNFLTLCGLLAGSMTDPPALAFAGAMTRSEAPSVAYATVYPLVMLLRVVAAQTLVLVLMR